MNLADIDSEIIALMPEADNIKWGVLYFISEEGQLGQLSYGRLLHSVPLEPHQLGVIVGILTKVLRQQITDFECEVDRESAVALREALETTLALEEIKPGDNRT